MPYCCRMVIFSVLVLLGCLVGCSPSGPSRGTGQQSPTDSSTDKTDADIGNAFAFDELLNETTLENPPRFQEVAREVGLTFQYYNDARQHRYFFPEILGGGIACFDYDLNGQTDVYCANGRGLPLDNEDDQHFDQMFQAIGAGNFRNATSSTRIHENRFSHGCAFGDLNSDGFDDIAIAGFATKECPGISVYLNQGDGTFLRAADHDVNIYPTWSTCPLITDINQDDHPDLLVVNYVGWTYLNEACTYESIRGYCGPGQFQPLRNYVFINDQQGGLPERGEELGFTQRGKGLATAAVDFDQDLSPEIYIANDLVVNYLYQADPDQPGLHHEIGGPQGVSVADNGQDEASMSVTPADFDRNGYTDLFVTNYYKQKNTLYLNREGKRFQDVSLSARTHATGELFLGFGALPLDFDKDGWVDIFVGNGHVLGPEHNPNQMTDQILRNEEGIFEDVSSSAGSCFRVRSLSRGSATIDLDQDLDTDVLVNHLDRPMSVLRNETQTVHHAIGVSLVSPQHRPLEGSRIDVVSDGKTVQTIPVTAGGSYLSDPERKWIVGVGQQRTVDVTVHWRDGHVDQWNGLEVDCDWRFAPGRKWSRTPTGSQETL